MKKLLIKSVSLMLILVMSALMMFSCGFSRKNANEDVKNGNHTARDFFPEGYTCGFHIQPGSLLEYWWVETYEECMLAIEQLKAHGSTFSDDVMFVYEGDSFDTKYCFVFQGKTDEIKFGDNPFDRYAENVRIDTYAFFDDVALDELNYSYVFRYEAYRFGTNLNSQNAQGTPIKEAVIGDWSQKAENYDVMINAKYNEITVLVVIPEFNADLDDVNSFRMTREIISKMLENGRVEIFDNEELTK